LIRGAADFRIQGTRWVNWLYDAIELTSATQGPPLDENTSPADPPPDPIERGIITGNIFRSIGRDTNDDGVGGGESYAIQIGSTVANLIVSNNELIDCINGIVAAAYNRGIIITGNRIVLEAALAFASSGIGVEQLSKHSTVATNTVIGAYKVGINIEAAQHVSVTGNVVNGAHFGISAFGSTVSAHHADLRDVSITGNTVTSTLGPAIRVVRASAANITGNVVTGGQFGVFVANTVGAAVVGNHITGTRTGIGVSSSTDITVTGNTVSRVSVEGLYLGRGNNRIGVFSNVSTSNGYGLYSETGQSHVHVATNTFLNNSTGNVFIANAATNGVVVVLGIDSSNRVQLGGSTATILMGGPLIVATVGFAELGTPANGTILYCSDCDPLGSLACTSAGPKTGAFAYRVNGSWRCQG
jgi:parallel beta-helix repeat protein